MNFKILILGVLCAFFLVAVLSIHPFGKPSNTEMDDYFIQNGQVETGSNNIVASVLFDYRGMDTIGEATLLFAAASGIFIVFRGKKNE